MREDGPAGGREGREEDGENVTLATSLLSPGSEKRKGVRMQQNRRDKGLTVLLDGGHKESDTGPYAPERNSCG